MLITNRVFWLQDNEISAEYDRWQDYPESGDFPDSWDYSMTHSWQGKPMRISFSRNSMVGLNLHLSGEPYESRHCMILDENAELFGGKEEFVEILERYLVRAEESSKKALEMFRGRRFSVHLYVSRGILSWLRSEEIYSLKLINAVLTVEDYRNYEDEEFRTHLRDGIWINNPAA